MRKTNLKVRAVFKLSDRSYDLVAVFAIDAMPDDWAQQILEWLEGDGSSGLVRDFRSIADVPAVFVPPQNEQ